MRWKATPGLRRPNERTERPPSQRERGHRAGSGTARSGGALGDTVSLLLDRDVGEGWDSAAGPVHRRPLDSF
ncbi:hypothetical protein MLD38_018747 [Melastoma candidum]|uniref:Uncharacterized protein n=1 Tax=Melastoma candidum TaxID=119954 RepID=A0ACB9QU79_9MYRT|nr:hypothetical protein MLD38_018747 [Melastoma candidum]